MITTSHSQVSTKIIWLCSQVKPVTLRTILSIKISNDIVLLNAELSRAHGLPKVHKVFENNSSYFPFRDRTGTTHYSVKKILSSFLNPFTQNVYSLKSFFDVVTRDHRILLQVCENDEYMFFTPWKLFRYPHSIKKSLILSSNAPTTKKKLRYHFPNVR